MPLISLENLERFKNNLSTDIDNRIDTATNGAVKVNEQGLIADSYLPSSVKNIREYATLSAFPAEGETGTLYIDLSTNNLYRWNPGDEEVNGGYVSTSIQETVKYTSNQGLTPEQQQNARNNIGAISLDDVPEAANNVVEITLKDGEGFPETGETGVIYIDTATNNTYRWDPENEEFVLLSAASANVIEGATVSDFPKQGSTGVVYIDKSTNDIYRWDADAQTPAYVSVSAADAVKFVAQDLNSTQKITARNNIGAASADLLNDAVKWIQQNPDGDGVQVTYMNDESRIIELSYDFPIKSVSYDGSYLYFRKEGNLNYFDPVKIEGGGSTVPTYVARLENQTSSVNLTVASSQRVFISFKYIETYGGTVQNQNGYITIEYKLSTEDDTAWKTIKGYSNKEIACNEAQRIEVTDYIEKGLLTKVRVTASNGRDEGKLSTDTLTYNITSVEVEISSTFDSTATYKGNFRIPYSCKGRGLTKYVHLTIDDAIYDPVPIGTSHNQDLYYDVTMTGVFAYGLHTARMWFETEESASSNVLTIPIIYDDGSSAKTIISASLNNDLNDSGIIEVENGEALNLQYVVYTPGQEKTDSLRIRVYTETEEEIEDDPDTPEIEQGTQIVITDYYDNTEENIDNNKIIPLPLNTYQDRGVGYVELSCGEGDNKTVLTLIFNVVDIQSEYDLNSIETGLVYSYKPIGYTNNSTGKNQYNYKMKDATGAEKTISTKMIDFNWITDGYLKDNALTLSGDARMEINLPILATSFINNISNNAYNRNRAVDTDPNNPKYHTVPTPEEEEDVVMLDATDGAVVTTNGRTIEFEFRFDNVTNENAVVFSCLDSQGIGFVITPQVCYLLAHGQTPIIDSTGFIENEESIPCAYIKDEKRIRVAFVIQKQNTITSYDPDKGESSSYFASFVNIFINGEYANSYSYAADAVYGSEATITIGSSECTTKIYDIRMYNRGLSNDEILQNYMNSNIDIRERIAANEYNDVLDEDTKSVDYIKAREKYPCLLFIGQLSNFKNDRKYVGVILTKPKDGGGYTTEFSLLDRITKDNVAKFVSSIKVQGTSSQRFMRKNFKVYLVKKVVDEETQAESTEKVKYVLKGYQDNDPEKPLSIGESTLCFKMDYMSTDHANTFNANIADTLFNDKPSGSLVQNTIWGFRCLLFNMPEESYVPGTPFEDYPSGTIMFAGDGCLNNDKSNTKTFGLETKNYDSGNVTKQQKWEFKDNSQPLCSFKTDRLFEAITIEKDDGTTEQKLACKLGLESCYPDEGDLEDDGLEPDYSYIQLLYTWLYQRANFWDASTKTYGRDGSGNIIYKKYDGQNYTNDKSLKRAIFKKEFPLHFNLEHALVYYLFIEWVALCDNRAKNMFLSCKDVTAEHIVFKDSNITSIWDIVDRENGTGVVEESMIDWDNSTFGLWYTDLYDLDSCFGAENSGYIRIPYYADWNYELGRMVGTEEDPHQFNGWDSRLWCMFEEAFASEISARAKVITKYDNGAGTLNYGVLKEVHITNNAELVCPAVVNPDMIYKYEDAWTKGYWDYSKDSKNPEWVRTSEYKYLQRGSRTEQKESFIYRRSNMLYSKYLCDQFKNDRLAFRCGSPVAKADAGITMAAVQALYMGVQYGDSGSPVMTSKTNAGIEATVYAPNDLGRSDNCYILGASNLTEISDLSIFHPYEIGLTGAKKLRTLLIGSSKEGYSNGSLSSLNTANMALLEVLNIQNCTGFTDSPINLSENKLIRKVYAGGSTVPYFTFANGGILDTLELGTPRRILLQNQALLQNFSYDSLNNLAAVRIEGTPNTHVLDFLTTKVPQTIIVDGVEEVVEREVLSNLTLGLRLIDLNETVTDIDYNIFRLLTSDMPKGKRMGDDGFVVNNKNAYPVITGVIRTAYIGNKTLLDMREIYGEDLEIIVTRETVDEYVVNYLNYDGSVVYTTYVKSGSFAPDPVVSGYCQAPSRPEDERYTYVYQGWTGLTSEIESDTEIYADYLKTEKTFTVQWFAHEKDEDPLRTVSDIQYGSCVDYMFEYNTTTGAVERARDLPVYKEEESLQIYNVFKGWDKSTGYIRDNLKVYAQWDRGKAPAITDPDNLPEMKDLSISQIYAISQKEAADDYFQQKDSVQIQVGKDFEYSNVASATLIGEPRYFKGQYKVNNKTVSDIQRFDDIKLFEENAPSFTLAVDFEFTEATSDSTLISCCDTSGTSEGFRVYYYTSSSSNLNHSIRVQWGDKTATIAHGLGRHIVVLKHRQGTKGLSVYSDNGGVYLYHYQYYGNSYVSSAYMYDGYNESILATELVRAQDTITDASLSFGAIAQGSQGASSEAKGWIHWAKIWYDDLGEFNARELASWPHEIWTMQYKGSGIYNRADSTGLKTGMTFIAAAPLDGFIDYLYTASNYKWSDSRMRAFVNKRCFEALPYEWQSIICLVRLSTKNPYSSDSTSNTNTVTFDKLYLPAYADLTSSSVQSLAQEGRQASWMNTNYDRIKYIGFVVPDNSRLFTEPTDQDPTLYTEENKRPKEGDIWNPSNSTSLYYYYVPADKATTHGVIGGRYTSDSNNIAAANTEVGGLWILPRYYLTRSSSETNTNYQYTVSTTGSVTTYYSYSNSSYTHDGIVLMWTI
mgnify:CR=1 FL=1